MPGVTFPIMADLAESLTRELRRAGLLDDLCILTVMPGEQVAWDYVDEGGMAWVRLVRAFPTAAFPEPDVSVGNCVYTLGYEVEMGALRQAPGIDQHGNLPTEDDHLLCVEKQYADMEAMYRALTNVDIDLKVVNDYTPVGPAGGGVGGFWGAIVGQDL